MLALIRDWRAEAPSEMGLNPFLIASEGDMSETAHSYALKEFLNPDKANGLYLREFVSYLASVAESRGFRELAEDLRSIDLDGGVSVSVEEPTAYQETASSKLKKGRIDVLIEAKDRSWAIIIENKIKGAPDMPRQLFRYVKGKAGRDGHELNVKAVVYLKALTDDVACPANADDAKTVAPIFLPIAASKSKTDGAGLGLVDGWLEVLAENDLVPAADKVVLGQYVEVIGRIRQVLERDDAFERILGCLVKKSGGVTVGKGCPEDVKEELGLFLARRVAFNVTRGAFSSLEVYRRDETIAVFDSLKLFADDSEEHYLGLKLDVKCEGVAKDGKLRVRLFSEKCCCSDDMGGQIKKGLASIGDIVTDCARKCKGLAVDRGCRCAGFNFVIDMAESGWRVKDLENILSDFVVGLTEAKEEMELNFRK